MLRLTRAQEYSQTMGVWELIMGSAPSWCVDLLMVQHHHPGRPVIPAWVLNTLGLWRQHLHNLIKHSNTIPTFPASVKSTNKQFKYLWQNMKYLSDSFCSRTLAFFLEDLLLNAGWCFYYAPPGCIVQMSLHPDPSSSSWHHISHQSSSSSWHQSSVSILLMTSVLLMTSWHSIRCGHDDLI